MLDKLVKYDTELFLYLNNLGNETWDWLWVLITHKLTFAPLYAILLFVIYKKFGLKTLGFLIVVIAVMVTVTDQGTNAFKHGVERLRPCRTEGVSEFTRVLVGCGKYGFFSGHSSNSMAAAIFGGLLLMPFYRRLIYGLIAWSLIVAYSRIYVGVHYPLDIICGLIYGTIVGYLFFKLQMYLRQRYAKFLQD